MSLALSLLPVNPLISLRTSHCKPPSPPPPPGIGKGKRRRSHNTAPVCGDFTQFHFLATLGWGLSGAFTLLNKSDNYMRQKQNLSSIKLSLNSEFTIENMLKCTQTYIQQKQIVQIIASN